MRAAEDSTLPDRPTGGVPLQTVPIPPRPDPGGTLPMAPEPPLADSPVPEPPLAEPPTPESAVADAFTPVSSVANAPVAEPAAAEAPTPEVLVPGPADEEPAVPEPAEAELPTPELPVPELAEAEPAISEPADAESGTTGTAAEPLREPIAGRYGPAVAFYRLSEDRLRETGPAGPGSPIGWAPHLQALRALRDGQVTGRWEDLARLMVDPAALTDPGAARPQDRRPGAAQAAVDTPHALLVEVPAGPERTAVIARIVERLAAEGARTLLMASPAASEAVLECLGEEPGVLAVRAESGTGTEPGAPEGRPYTGTIHAAGTAHARAWKAELRRLRRDLLWLEQWPRDQAALAAGRAEAERHREEQAARVAAAEAEIGEHRAAAAAAGRATAGAREEHDRVAADHRRAADEAMALRAEYAGLQTAADAAARTAEERARAAEECRTRCSALEQRAEQGNRELEAAREREKSLIEELARARQALPESAAQAERLYAAEADAAAEGHRSYYRLAAAESARAAQKRGTSLGQRMMRPAPERQELRRQVGALKREADEAATRARQAKEALDRAESEHARLAAFVANGGTELIALRDTQERLAEEIVRLTAETEAVRSGLDDRLRMAAGAAEQAASAAAAAQHARQVGLRGEERLTEARVAEGTAAAAVERAQEGERAAERRLTGAGERLESLREQAAAGLAEDEAEIGMLAESELGSRAHVEEICGEGPSTAAEGVLSGHRERAMARIEQVSGYLDQAGDPAPAGGVTADLAEVLLGTSVLACGTPLDVAAGPLARMDGFDVLIADDAGSLTDAEFLIGAVRARRWILVGGGDRPPEGTAYPGEQDHLHALAALRLTEQAAPGPGEAGAGGGSDELDAAIETVAARWGEEEPVRRARLPEVRAEAVRLRDGGLWEARYRDSYERALRRSRPPGGTEAEAERNLAEVLRPTLFERCAAAGPHLLLVPGQAPGPAQPED
jgi:hypothetical protein